MSSGDSLTYIYSVKIVCVPHFGPASPALMPAKYRTAVNVHNPWDQPANIEKWVTLSPPQGDPAIMSEHVSEVLNPWWAFDVDCKHMKNDFVFPSPLPPPHEELKVPGGKGFMVIRSDRELDVVAIYTSRSETATTANGVGTSIDVEYIVPKRAQSIVPPTVDLITNGSFESGNFDGWTVTNMADPFAPWQVSPADSGNWFGNTMPQDGLLDAWNGFDGCGPDEFTMFQDVSVPAGSPPDLSWRDRIQWDMTFGATLARDYEVQLRDPVTNAVLSSLFSFSTAPDTVGDTGWQTHTADLSPFSDSTVRLYFVETIPECYTGPAQFEIDAITTLPLAPSADGAPTSGLDTGGSDGGRYSEYPPQHVAGQ